MGFASELDNWEIYGLGWTILTSKDEFNWRHNSGWSFLFSSHKLAAFFVFHCKPCRCCLLSVFHGLHMSSNIQEFSGNSEWIVAIERYRLLTRRMVYYQHPPPWKQSVRQCWRYVAQSGRPSGWYGTRYQSCHLCSGKGLRSIYVPYMYSIGISKVTQGGGSGRCGDPTVPAEYMRLTDHGY
jgi:hypothetical protein